ncbi:MAG: hypothetical protein JW801_00530 [Bacteroidales bacterium]|nr:hypothetical protein [Bacteroidales bacterium]
MRYRILTAFLPLFLLCGSCEKASYQEMLLIDVIFTHVNTDADDKYMGFSIFSYPDSLPSNWTKPANFKDGVVYYRVSVISKPDDRTVYYQTGFQWEGGCEGNSLKEKFPHRDMIPITSPGIYTASQTLSSFWEPSCQEQDPIDWSTPMDRILVVMMNENFAPIDNRWGYGYDIQDIDSYFPMEVHLQVVVVPEGGIFSGWDNYEIAR